MVVLHTCKNEEDPIKNEGARVLTNLFHFFRRPRAANSEVSGGILLKFKLIQAFIIVLVTCKNEEDPIKNEKARVLTRFSHYKSMGIFSDAQGYCSLLRSPWSNLAEIRTRSDIMVVLVTCKYEEVPIKNEGARVLTRFSPL